MNEQYEAPSVIDLGSVAEVTLSGGSPFPDGLMDSANLPIS